VTLLAGLVLLWPVPIHGGITILGEILYRELGSALRQQQRDQARQQQTAYTQRLADRVAAPLPFTVTQPLAGSWAKVQTAGGVSAWHDSSSGLLWSQWLPLPASAALPTLETARNRCRQQPPAGYWALATETENYHLWKAGGEQQLPAAPASSVAQLLDSKTRLEMPTYAIKHTADNNRQNSSQNRTQIGSQSSARQRHFVIRCTARSPDAPVGGYNRSDIPLQQWNRFQMRRLLSGEG
jgi:hypothetical protein